jgi:hypothetical protein
MLEEAWAECVGPTAPLGSPECADDPIEADLARWLCEALDANDLDAARVALDAHELLECIRRVAAELAHCQ